jgi:aldehyde:ferredoxin oxidoreductase
MGTYIGRMLDIDLSSGVIKTFALDEEVLRNFIGGSGLAAKLLFDRVPPDVGPFSEGNVLFVMTGPLAGTTLPAVSRFTTCFKSPLTGIWGEANSGGNLAPELKAAGYDGVAITGNSKKPVYIVIEDESVEIKDASDLWGKDSYETSDLLKKRLGGKREARVLCIGQAGENLVRYATLINDKAAFAARCGGGAVMGSKKLKAIAVRGSGKVKPALPTEYAQIRRTVLRKLKESLTSQALREYGTNLNMGLFAPMGDVPLKNWTLGEAPELIPKIDVNALTTYVTRSYACQGCPIASKKVAKVEAGPYQMAEGPGPQYQTIASLGSLLMNENIAAICKLNEVCNRYGIDTISCGGTIAFAMECFEKGLITSKDLDGGQLRWGNADDILGMVDKIAHRQGFGNVLAEGSRRAAQRVGKGAPSFAVEVKGLEVPMHDPRPAHNTGLAYAMSNRGACHLENLVDWVMKGACAYPEIGLPGGYDGKVSEGMAEMVALCQDLGSLANAAVICHYAFSSLAATDLLDMLRTTTGFDYDLKELMQCGERIWMLKKGLNNLMGITAADDRLPEHIMIPLQDGPAAGLVPDLKLMLKEYYELRGLDANGRPLKEKLNNLGLSDLAARLQQ